MSLHVCGFPNPYFKPCLPALSEPFPHVTFLHGFYHYLNIYNILLFKVWLVFATVKQEALSAGLLFAHYSQRAPFLSFIVLIAVFTFMSFLFVHYTATSILTPILHSPQSSYSSAYYIELYCPHPCTIYPPLPTPPALSVGGICDLLLTGRIAKGDGIEHSPPLR